VFKGDLIKKEDTYLKKLVKSGDNLLLISGSFVAIKYKRFPRFVTDDYFHMSDTYWDAIKIKPNVDIYLLGFGLMNHSDKSAFTCIYKILLEDEEVLDGEIEC
jgi:hypothetical protein